VPAWFNDGSFARNFRRSTGQVVALKATILERLPTAQAREVSAKGWIAGAPVMHGDGAAAERRDRDQLEPSRAEQSALVEAGP
jgi:hypothetical protein